LITEGALFPLPRHLIRGLVGSGLMKKLLGIIVIGLLLVSCSKKKEEDEKKN